MASIERTFLLRVPSSTQNLALVREFINSIGIQAGLEEPEVLQLMLAVDEACANVIEHAYGNDATKEVLLRAVVSEESLEIKVEDTGVGFDPTSSETETLEQLVAKRKKGGLGLRIMQNIMDEVHYDIEPGRKNQLRMVKRLRPSSPEEPAT